jgi:PAS domain S-box-containing protein
MAVNSQTQLPVQHADTPREQRAIGSPSINVAADAFLAAIIESSDDAIISKSLDGIITSWNSAAERIFGHTAEDVIGQSIYILIPPERVEEEVGILARLRRGERVEHFETVRMHKNGARLDVSLTISPIKDRDGKLIGASKIARDITGRRRAEYALQQSEAIQAGILASALDSIITINHERMVLEFNPAAERTFGYVRHEAIGKRIDELIVPPAYREAHIRGLTRYLTTGESHILGRRVEVVAMRSDRSEFPCELEIIRVPLDGPPLFTAFVRDITERKRIEAELSKAREGLETTIAERTASLQETIFHLESFSYSITHDMRGPLRAISGFAHVLEEDYGERLDDRARDLLARMGTAAVRLDRLIQDVLTYSRLKREEMPMENVSVLPLIKDIVSQYPEIKTHADEIEIALGDCHPQVRANLAALTQCLSNLLGNAVKFVVPGKTPRVRIACEERGPNTRLWIEDNGIGIPPEQQKQIFGVFHRLHGATEYSGTGIGLAIVKAAIERMNGSVGVESEPGRGSRFWIELPRAQTPETN